MKWIDYPNWQCLWEPEEPLHFWIFHRCDPMPNLKKFCHSLHHEMVSHLFPFLKSISKLSLRLFDPFHRRFSHSISEACSSHSRRLMRMTIKSMYSKSMRTFRNVKYFFLRFFLPFYFRTSLIKFAC